jgi:hypothetical protein
MRQVFSSSRLENVERVAELLGQAGIDTKVSEGRGYRKLSRREFSYVEKMRDPAIEQPAVWVLKSDDYKRARELLHEIGVLESTQTPSYLPSDLQTTASVKPNPQNRLLRIKLGLLLAIGVLAGLMALRMF